MPVSIKTADDIEHMRIAGRQAASVLEMIDAHVKPGITTGELDAICHDFIVNTLDAIPAPLNYRNSPLVPPFPKSICTSVNHVVCHGIPSEKKVLKNGDVINIDITVIKNGWHGDTSRMFFVGAPSVLAERLVSITQECMYRGIAAVRPGGRLGDIGHAVQAHAEANGFSVVREYCGHGIGLGFHEDPQILHYGRPGTGMELEPGMTFTIEPMINAGKRHVKLLPDQWTVVTKDHKLTAQYEHTILVTDTGVDILTLRNDEAGNLPTALASQA